MFRSTSSSVFESPRRSNNMLNQWRQYYLLLLFYQIIYSRENNRLSFGFQNAKQQMESMSEQPVSSKRFIAVFKNNAKIRVSRLIDFHGVNNLVHLLVRKLACAGF